MFETAELRRSLDRATYETLLPELRSNLLRVQNELYEHKKFPVIVLIGGVDGAGKGETVNTLHEWMDPRYLETNAFGPLSDEERERPDFWRFWRHLPRAGRVTIFDRSWYGRVLVERVEGFASEAEWMRAYKEINDFEQQLAEHGIVVLKFWLHISPDEQLRRFQEREATSYKQYKITAEDSRNRQQWEAYETAVQDMVERTSTEYAPWHLIEANDEYHARAEIVRTFCKALAKRLKG